jgi:hypothetical protein
MKYLESDLEYDYYTSFFQGIEVRWTRDRKTQQFYINSDDGARLLGFDSLDDMLSKEPKLIDSFLDGINNGLVKLYKNGN